MRAKKLPRRIVYLELLDSLLDGDGGEGRARNRLQRDFPWVFGEGWEIERWGLLRSNRAYPSKRGSLRGPTFPFRAFPRVLLPVVVWATQFVQSLLRPRTGIMVAYTPLQGVGAAAAGLFRRRSSALIVRMISDFSAPARLLYGKGLEARILQTLEPFVLRRADLVLPMSSFTRDIVRQAGVPEERILELPHPARWLGKEVTLAEGDGAPRVTCAGRMVPEKGFDLLIAAFAELTEEFPDVLLDVAGDGPQRSNLEALATSLGIADRVRFRGWLGHEMPRFFEGALVCVLPSRVNEGLGMVLIEAALAGCALIGADLGGIRDIVHPDRTGILVPPYDPGALADALRTLLRDPQRARRMGAAAQAEARAYVGRRDEALERVRERLEALRDSRARRDASEH